jgi:hypothetical protein
MRRLPLIILTLTLSSALRAQSWNSSIVVPGAGGRWEYVRDAEGNRIPDFSYAGYRNGNVSIPDIPVVKTIGSSAGDNTANIQTAINEVAIRPLDANGFRGAILLTAGAYRVSGTIQLNASGIVLRGAGDDADTLTNTVILATGDSATQTTVLRVGGSSDTKWSDQVAGTKVNIVSDTVLVGERSFTIADAIPFHVGDNIVIYHPCTDAWLQAVNYGDTRTDAAWTVNQLPIIYNRYITAISGNTITIDAPVFNTLIRSRAQSYIYKYGRSGIRTNVGVENLRIDIQALGVTTDANGNEHDHAWDAFRIQQVEDAWIRNCTALHFGQSGFKTSTATRVTIDSCRALDPVCIITGERRYNFNTYQASQLILFRDCSATRGRHDFVSNGTSSVSGIVFLRGRSQYAYASSEGHRQWSQGMLYDNVSFSNSVTTGYVLGLYSRGDYGTGHGWAAVHSVAWNCNLGRGLVLQKPPTAQNYAVGCYTSGVTASSPFANPLGFVEGTNTAGLTPASLYESQRNDRLGDPSSVETNDRSDAIPTEIRLEQNYPNPFNPKTVVSYQLPVVSGQSSVISIKVYDLLGCEVAVLVNEVKSPGRYHITLDGSNLTIGMYFCELSTGEFRVVKKMMLLK